jgi:hypothetical protein
VAASYERLFLWRYRLREVIDALIRHPISQGPGGVSAADVAQCLQQLPLRQAYVRIGNAGQVLQTLPLTPGVEPEEDQRRRLQLRQQTRQTLCRHVSTAESVRDQTPATEQSVAAPAPEPHTRPPSAGTPLTRRSRPLP